MTSVLDESVNHTPRLVLLLKGKRTKRQRSASPLLDADCEAAGEVEFQGTTDEDEDIANCLMLLSQGHEAKSSSSCQKTSFYSNKKPLAASSLGLGLEDGVYQCKTCDKSFYSFQALGGHRASHKKPKIESKCYEKKATFASAVEAGAVGSFLTLQVTSSDGNKKREKTHECSICKAEFSSGQALGGHMRRHRGLTVIKTAISSSSASSHEQHHEESIRSKNFLQLDLNLPAPEDEPKLAFASKDQILSFTGGSNSLIDCHH